MASPKNIH